MYPFCGVHLAQLPKDLAVKLQEQWEAVGAFGKVDLLVECKEALVGRKR